MNLWNENPGARAAYKAVNRLARTPDKEPIESLVHPFSGETCHDDAAKAEALRYHLAAIAQESYPRMLTARSSCSALRKRCTPSAAARTRGRPRLPARGPLRRWWQVSV